MSGNATIVMTRSVADWVGDDHERRDFLNEALAEHFTDPFCGVCEEDGEQNIEALKAYLADEPGRVLTTHHWSDGERVWVITQWGDNAEGRYTTVLFPTEY